MKNQGKRLILISFSLAVALSIAIFIYLKPLKTPNTAVNEITVLVATETIAERTKIEMKMIKEIQVPDNAIFEGYIMDAASIVGKYTNGIIIKDEGFHKDKLLSEQNKELSLKIEGNNRAISINVNGKTGVSDLLKEGDFVDVILFLAEKKDGQETVRPDLTKILLQNIKILAIDKAQDRDGEERIEVPTNFLVTLAVPIFDIEKLILAEDIGELKLVLRPLESDSIHKTEGATWQELIMDDFKEMKNLFPDYKIKQVEESKGNTEGYKYKEYTYYKVKKGDNLRKISEEFYGDSKKYTLLKQVNGILNENLIEAGTGIKIPVLEK